MMISKWITFNQTGQSESGKTDVWFVCSANEDKLGEVRWYGRWRKYSFFPENDTIFEEECLRDISFFVEQLTRKHKQK